MSFDLSFVKDCIASVNQGTDLFPLNLLRDYLLENPPRTEEVTQDYYSLCRNILLVDNWDLYHTLECLFLNQTLFEDFISSLSGYMLSYKTSFSQHDVYRHSKNEESYYHLSNPTCGLVVRWKCGFYSELFIKEEGSWHVSQHRKYDVNNKMHFSYYYQGRWQQIFPLIDLRGYSYPPYLLKLNDEPYALFGMNDEPVFLDATDRRVSYRQANYGSFRWSDIEKDWIRV